MMAKKLSATMVSALDDATAHGGTLVRFQGGFWSWPNVARTPHDGVPVDWVRPSTVAALVDRGEMTYSEWKEGRNGRFPIAATVTTRADGAD